MDQNIDKLFSMNFIGTWLITLFLIAVVIFASYKIFNIMFKSEIYFKKSAISYFLVFVFIFGFLSAFILGSLGFITGLWAEKFDHTATVTNFVITPLSFLSGVFYSIDKLPNFFQIISHINPFFYMIDGFRYGFLGTSDGSIIIGITYLTILSFVMSFLAYYLYKVGYKIKS